MGKGQSKLKRADAVELAAKHGVPKSEVEELHRAFHSEYPDGQMSRETFLWIFKQFFPRGNPIRYAEHLFSVFDTDNSNTVSFEEFMEINALISGKDLEQKLKLVFKVYDVDGNGAVEKSEMIKVVSYMYEMIGDMAEMPKDEATAEMRVNKLWDAWKVGDRSVDEKEFVHLSKEKSNAISELLPDLLGAK